KEITARQGVPQRYLEQVMQQLVRAGILKGVRGPRGGYRLAPGRRRITGGATGRPGMWRDPSEAGFGAGPGLGRRGVVPPGASLQEDVMKKLDEISIEDICRSARSTGLDCNAPERPDTADFTL